MEEKWAPIPGFPNYEISNTGKIERMGKTKRTPVKVSRQVNYVFASLSAAPYKSKQVNVVRIMDECFSEHIYSDTSKLDAVGEVWKDVVGWEQSYEVSNLGRVRTKVRTRKGKNGTEAIVSSKLKSSYVDEDGYCRISLYEDGRNKLLGLHRVVAEAFIPNPKGLPQVNHKDGDKQNNCCDNLEWCSNTDNIRHSIKSGLRDTHVYRRPVKRLSDGYVFESIAALHRSIGGSYNEIVHILKLSDNRPVCVYGDVYQCIPPHFLQTNYHILED